MKEYIEVLHDSFVDYKGEEHHFTIAAISQTLPKIGADLEKDCPCERNRDSKLYFDVERYLEDWGAVDTLCTIKKVLYIGIAICNPVDKFDEITGTKKAIARARKNIPALFAKDPGTINSIMVQALLKQESEYLKDNPSNL